MGKITYKFTLAEPILYMFLATGKLPRSLQTAVDPKYTKQIVDTCRKSLANACENGDCGLHNSYFDGRCTCTFVDNLNGAFTVAMKPDGAGCTGDREPLCIVAVDADFTLVGELKYFQQNVLPKFASHEWAYQGSNLYSAHLQKSNLFLGLNDGRGDKDKLLKPCSFSYTMDYWTESIKNKSRGMQWD